jgi:hypothetical protein
MTGNVNSDNEAGLLGGNMNIQGLAEQVNSLILLSKQWEAIGMFETRKCYI